MPGSRTHWVLLLLAVAAAASLRIYEFRGFSEVDDAAYGQIAHQIAEGRFVPGSYAGPAVFPLRVGILYPTALAYRALGVGEWSLVLFPFVLSLLSVGLAYACARHLFGPVAGLLAAAIWALLPIDAFHASILTPDLPAAFFAGLGVLAILPFLDSPDAARLRQVAAGLVAGVLLGISWLCKESVIYLAPFCAVMLLASAWKDRGRSIGLWVGVAAGSVGVLAVEMLVYHGATGDWLFHMHETERNYRQYPNAFFIEGSRLAGGQGSYLKAVVRRVVLTGPLTIFFNSHLMYLPLVALIAAARALYWRSRSFLVPGLWFASLAFMFNFASSSFRSYVPLVLFDRYLYPVMLPATVMVAGLLGELLVRNADQPASATRERRFWGALIALALVLVAVRHNHTNANYHRGWASESRTVSRLLTPSDTVYTDILTIHGLEFFWSYPERMNAVNFEGMTEGASIRAGDHVLINRNHLDWLESKGGWWPTQGPVYREPVFAKNIPASWDRVWATESAALYRVR